MRLNKYTVGDTVYPYAGDGNPMIIQDILLLDDGSIYLYECFNPATEIVKSIRPVDISHIVTVETIVNEIVDELVDL